MDADKKRVVNRICIDFESAYGYFLRDERLRDTPVVRAGFYAGIKRMVIEGPPVPDPEVQEELLRQIDLETEASVTEYLEVVEFTVNEAASLSAARY